jgi:hypothetical protein
MASVPVVAVSPVAVCPDVSPEGKTLPGFSMKSTSMLELATSVTMSVNEVAVWVRALLPPRGVLWFTPAKTMAWTVQGRPEDVALKLMITFATPERFAETR